jgi:hypothetical protein
MSSFRTGRDSVFDRAFDLVRASAKSAQGRQNGDQSCGRSAGKKRRIKARGAISPRFLCGIAGSASGSPQKRSAAVDNPAPLDKPFVDKDSFDLSQC